MPLRIGRPGVTLALLFAIGMLSFIVLRPVGSRTSSSPAITVVEGRLYRSQQPLKDDWARLQRAIGLKTVINLRDPAERDDALATEPSELSRIGIQYINIPIHRMQPTNEQLAQFLSLVTDPAEQPVLVHCEMGRARTGVMIAAYRITAQHWPAAKAIEEMNHFYTGVMPGTVRRYLENLSATATSSRVE